MLAGIRTIETLGRTFAKLPQTTKRENLWVQDWNSSSNPRHINAGLSKA
jgi:hypothetical protein